MAPSHLLNISGRLRHFSFSFFVLLLSCGDQQSRVHRDLSIRDNLDKIKCDHVLRPIHSFVHLFICLFVYTETDGRFRLTEDLLEAEREFLVNLRTIYDVYERPLRKLCSISDEEKRLLFGGVEPVLSVSNMLLTKANNMNSIFFRSSLHLGGRNKWLSNCTQWQWQWQWLASSPIHTKCHLIFIFACHLIDCKIGQKKCFLRATNAISPRLWAHRPTSRRLNRCRIHGHTHTCAPYSGSGSRVVCF